MKSKIENYLTIEQARELFEIKGSDVVWKNPTRYGTIPAGTIAGCINNSGYRHIQVTLQDGIRRSFLAHTISFGLHNNRWAEHMLDHKDTNRLNNTPENIREAHGSINMHNRKINTNTRTGVKGVSYEEERLLPYHAQLSLKGRRVFNARYRTLVEAKDEIQKARVLHHGEFANHG